MNHKTQRRLKNRSKQNGKATRAGHAAHQLQTYAVILVGGLGLTLASGGFLVALLQPDLATSVWTAIAAPLSSVITSLIWWPSRSRK